MPEKSVTKLTIADLQNQYSLLDFLLKKEVKKITKETELSLKAGELVGKIYSAFQKQYNDPTAKKSLESLNRLQITTGENEGGGQTLIIDGGNAGISK